MGTCLILLGLLSICSLCFSQECAQELSENVDFPGTDITFLYSPDARHCQQLCTEHPSCLFFTFVRHDWTNDNRNFYCYIKATPSEEPNVRTPLQGVTSGFSLKKCPSDLQQPDQSQLYQNVDFLGADYESLFTSSVEECQRVCTQDPGCRFFTFANEDFTRENIRYKCHLKHSWSIPRTPVIKREVGAVSGFCPKLQMTQYFGPVCQGELLLNTEIPGHDIDKLTAASAEHCQALCTDNPRCTYFSYTSDTFQCNLKGNPTELVTRVKVGVTSGIPVRFCQMNDSWLQVSYEGVSFPGSDLRFESVDDPDKCQKSCTTDPLCQFYTYFEESYSNSDFRRRCYLKRVITAPAPPTVNKLNNVVSGFSLRSECAQELSENVDFPGTDITFLYSPDARHCQQLCTEHPSCLFFTFVRHDWTNDNRNFYCYIKSTPSGEPNVRTPLQGVTSGFSLKKCTSELQQPDQSQLYQDVDFLGADYKSLFTSSVEECQRVCTQDPGCRFFTFANDDFTRENIRYKCHLKHSWSIPRTPVIKREVGAVSGFCPKLQMTQYFGPVCQGELLLNTEIPGHDIDKLTAASAEHCQALCTDNPRCTYFSYTSDTFQCNLKGNPAELVTRVKVGVTSGIPVRFCQMNDSWLQVSYEGVSFQGSDLRFESMDDPDKCQRTCTTDPLCQFYTYFEESYSNSDFRHRCYLKSVITAPAPPTVNKLKNVVSGFSLKSCV